MPIYEYRCTVCGHEIEVIHGIDAARPTECEVCGGAMRKTMSAPAIHFKGSGWAKKDAQTASKKSQPSTSKSDTPSSPKESDAKSASPEKKSSAAGDSASSDSKAAAPSTSTE